MSTEPSSVPVALSGGGDSALSAALLKEQGWRVKGLHFLLPAPAVTRTERQNSVRRIEERLEVEGRIRAAGAVSRLGCGESGWLQALVQGLAPARSECGPLRTLNQRWIPGA